MGLYSYVLTKNQYLALIKAEILFKKSLRDCYRLLQHLRSILGAGSVSVLCYWFCGAWLCASINPINIRKGFPKICNNEKILSYGKFKYLYLGI